ncbi:hypothetical protein F5Y11DRAFT_43136 [Daldinia sp. FL1419]|nr:hypothetical protein F5Y11DRAFT_43136 [Daldinia sp. FL1419]
MAFSFENAASGAAPEPIQTEALGFLSLSGNTKLRLTSQWSPPPANNASLLSIASRQGLVAAAGPDGVVISSTEAVRKAFESPKDGDNDIRAFEPPLKLSLPIRICQLAFTTDGAYLILSAEQGGGLAVYETQSLLQGSTQAAFEISTNGESLRALVPNPSLEMSELCAVVTSEGKLLMASMKERDFIPGPTGPFLRDQVSCVAWSNKGKQLVAGLGDGTMQQMTPKGEVKANIPRPQDLDANYFVSSLVWLENDLFLSFHVLASSDSPQTRCHLITRQDKNFQFQKLSDPVEPFGTNRTPHHTILRLRDFPPNLQDLLICSSTAREEVGLFTRSKTPLAPGAPSNAFTTTELADDSRRATLPMGEGMETPAIIGAALDLSSRENIYKPIPTDELDQSPGPLPGYWALNADGVLSVWWVVYSESIRGGTTYPGLVAVESNTANSTNTTVPKTAQSTPFGASNSSTFGAPSAATGTAFGSASALGTKSLPWGAQPSPSVDASKPTFGSSSFGTGAASTTPKFGTPAFGTSSFGSSPAPAFGQSTGLGARSSPWASGSASNTSAFGQSSFASNTNNTNGVGGATGPFAGSNPSPTGSSSGFASFANKGGFATFGTNINAAGGPSIFASTKSDAPEVSMDTDTSSVLRAPSSKPIHGTGNVFGTFKLTSSFQRDPNAADDDATEKSTKTEKSLFGSNFAATIDEPAKPAAAANPFATAVQTPFGKQASPPNADSTTPISTPATSKFIPPTPSTSQSKGIFGFQPKTPSGLSSVLESSTSQPPTSETPQAKTEPETPKLPKGILDTPLPPESTSKDAYSIGNSSTSSATSEIRGTPPRAEDAPLPPDFADSTPKPAEREASPKASRVATDDAPLPPDPVSNKVDVASLPPLPGMITKHKPVDNTPLPPDPVKQPKAYEAKLPALPIAKPPSEVVGPGFKFPTNPPPVPSDSEDDLSEEEGTEAVSEGSGVDVAKDLSPSSAGMNKTPGFTPQSSFDGLAGSFSTVSRPDQERRGLPGELGQNAPIFPQPNPVSPRSPSPVRGSVPPRMLGRDQSRSFSAPGMASQLLGSSRRQQFQIGPSVTNNPAYIEDMLEKQRKAKAKREAEEKQLLLDEEDSAIQNILKADLQPTLELDEFIAHPGAVPPAGDSVPAQVEAVYRDINSMIDTLGLNARSLANFIKGHKELYIKEYTRDDLATPDDWALSGLEGLARIIDEDLTNALEEARVRDMAGKLAECDNIQRELTRDRNKQADLRKIVLSRLDPEQTVANRSLPLSAEQAAQQSDLRREYAKFTKLLTEAEESLTLLKAKIVSANSANGKGGPTPTIEAVVRTITKLTTMVEKRSGDIDVLENQMRKLGVSSHGPGSREGSPFATPNGKRLSTSVFSPDPSIRESTPQRSSVLRHSVSGSIGGSIFNTPPRKKLGGFGDVEKKAVKEKRERKTAVLGNLRSSLQKRGVNVWAVDDIE